MKTIKVKIREWDDMVHQFGLNENGEVKCRYIFLPNMKHLCGQEEVELTFDEFFDMWYVHKDEDEWYISEDMIEPEYRNLMKVE